MSLFARNTSALSTKNNNKRNKGAQTAARRFRPLVENLEDRCVLSLFLQGQVINDVTYVGLLKSASCACASGNTVNFFRRQFTGAYTGSPQHATPGGQHAGPRQQSHQYPAQASACCGFSNMPYGFQRESRLRFDHARQVA